MRKKFDSYAAASTMIPGGLRGYGSDLADDRVRHIDIERLADLLRSARIAAFKEAAQLAMDCHVETSAADHGYVPKQILILVDQEEHEGPFPHDPRASQVASR